MCGMGCRTRVLLNIIFFVFSSLLIAITATAQLPTATILGVVRDSSGAVVPEANLTARNVETGQTRTTVTAADGSYRFSALAVGNYELRVEHPGFQTVVRTGLTLTVSQEATVNFSLDVGAIEQTVAVMAEAPLVNTTSGSLGGLVDEQRVADLPLNGRNFIDLSLLQPGVQQHKSLSFTGTMSGTFFSSNGAPVRSNNYLLDGASMVTVYGATSASIASTTLGVEGIREYRVVTNSFSAEYGMNMGSQMVIVSKNGTNSFHGSVFEYLRNSALDARNFFDRETATNTRRLPAFTRNNFGGSVGGPIQKDRTFFFAVFEALRERLGRSIVSDVIDPASKLDAGISPLIRPLLTLFPNPNLPKNQFAFSFAQPTTENYGQIRVDRTLAGNDMLFGRYTVDDTEQSLPRAYPQFRDERNSRAQFITLSENHIFSPSLLNTGRFSYSRTKLNADSLSGIRGPQFSLTPGLEIGSINIAGVTGFGPDAADPELYKQNIFTWSDDVFYTRGRHSVKFGALVNRFQQYVELNLQSKGSITFPNLNSFLAGQPATYTAATPGSIQSRSYHFTTLGFYLQDDLRVLSRLTLNLGLRYEFHTVPQESRGLGAALRDIQHDAATTLGPPFENPSLRNFSPRLGFAWDVRGDGLTSLRGGFGLLYDIGNLGSSLLQGAAATPPFSSASTVAGPAAPSLFTIPLFFPREAVGKSLRGPDYHLQQPHMLQYNLTLERQLPLQMAITVAYAGSRGINLIEVTDGNPTVPQVLADGRQFWPVGAPRTNPNWNNIVFLTGAGNSWYNSLQLGISKRLSKGLQFQSAYTWSKVLDETQGQLPADSNTSSPFRSDPVHRDVDRGPAAFDLAHNWRFNSIYRLPEFNLNPVAGKVVNGWWLSGILALQTGYPFTPTLGSNRSRSLVNGGAAGVDRPDLKSGRKNDNIVRGGADRYFDPSAFSVPAAGFLGTAGRNILRGPGFANVDFSAVKDTALGFLGENGKLEFRAEFFNILNRTNLGMPSNAVFAAQRDDELPLPTTGRIATTSGASRQIQLALKILF